MIVVTIIIELPTGRRAKTISELFEKKFENVRTYLRKMSDVIAGTGKKKTAIIIYGRERFVLFLMYIVLLIFTEIIVVNI